MKFKPTKSQQLALDKSEVWFKNKDKQVFEIAGYPGTGKTTIVSKIIENLGLDNEEVMFVTYVGKAALALLLKGNNARTIHSAAYELELFPKKVDGVSVLDEYGKEVMIPRFVKRDKISPAIKLIVVDEGGMIPEGIANDLMSFNVPMIVIGDNAQLPPIFGESYFLNKPDVTLTDLMRQSEDSDIVKIATMVRLGIPLSYKDYPGGSRIIRKKEVTDEMLMTSDICICGKNDTRRDLNKYIREELFDRRKNHPMINDKLICRMNNRNCPPIDNLIFLTNGLIGYVYDYDISDINKNIVKIDFRPDFYENKMFNNVNIDYKYLMGYSDKNDRFLNKFEYGYAITCHLAQGSEYDNVFIYNERMGTNEYYKRWLYTAVTRAKEKVILAV
jgi:exodeoxyribonuclease-5